VTNDEIKRLYEWLQSKVLVDQAAGELSTVFDEPTAVDFAEQGFDREAIALTLESNWWAEMVTDVVETPEYSEPGESPEKVLEYARDVVVEYIRKRLYT